jgi:hypothetical protein
MSKGQQLASATRVAAGFPDFEQGVFVGAVVNGEDPMAAGPYLETMDVRERNFELAVSCS